MALFTRKSDISGKDHTMDLPITHAEYAAWASDPKAAHIQHQWPHMTDDQREFLLTGITKEEWDEIFPEDED